MKPMDGLSSEKINFPEEKNLYVLMRRNKQKYIQFEADGNSDSKKREGLDIGKIYDTH